MKKTTICLLFSFLLFSTLSNALPANKENNFLVISDIHLDTTSTHIMDMSPIEANRDNDLDQATFTKLLTTIDNNIKNHTLPYPQFILVLGDVAGHKRYSDNSVLEYESMVFKMLKQHFYNIPIFYTFGNNDSLTTDYGPFQDADNAKQYKSPYDIAKLYGGWKDGFLSTGTLCKNKINHYPCILTENITNGYYSAYLDTKLKLISLNSILFSMKRKNSNEQDAKNQLQWLATELKIAKDQKEKVLITMHIPPGNNVYDDSHFWLAEEQTAFLSLIKTYQPIIVGLLAAHTHAEEIKIIKDTSGNIMTGVYYIPALSTSHGNEPAIKTFYFSHQQGQWALTNYTTYYFAIENANLVLNKLYDYQQYYCNNKTHDLSQCLNQVTADKMKKYFSAGNPNFSGTMQSPEDIILQQ